MQPWYKKNLDFKCLLKFTYTFIYIFFIFGNVFLVWYLKLLIFIIGESCITLFSSSNALNPPQTEHVICW